MIALQLLLVLTGFLAAAAICGLMKSPRDFRAVFGGDETLLTMTDQLIESRQW